jgi:hypothetical protein
MMECPHCRAEFEEKPHYFALGIDQDGTWQVSNQRCPSCDRLIVSICTKEGCSYPAWPATSARARLSDDVPADLAAQYLAASQVLPYSEEASAALSRRLLHKVLAAQSGAGYGGLADQIRRALASPSLPPYLKDALEMYVRVAKLEPDTTRSYRPEALVSPVEGEADWLLDLLNPLLEFYYVQPARLRRKRDALEERIAPPPPAPAPLALAPEEPPVQTVELAEAGPDVQ